MPTGYTYPVVEGKITKFSDFAMSCARAFGALISMKEDAMDAPIPDEIKPETRYYDERIAADLKRLSEIMTMTHDEAANAALAAHDEAVASRSKYLAGKEVEAKRLNAMMAETRAWHPPTSDHLKMKEFMIEQLTISMPGEYCPSIPVLLDGPAWRKQELEKLDESVVRNRAERAKEIERARGRTEWVKALRSSL